MSAHPPLPPPPPAQGWTQPSPALPPTPERPGWRQGKPGFVLLNLVIGFGVWLGELFVLGFVVSAFRPDNDLAYANDALAGWAFILAWLGALVGWIFFVYLDAPLRRRWFVFGSILGGTCLVCAMLLIRAIDIGGGSL
jgi:hypothetical protein